ncbi:MAG: PD-(D/E)XK nuclease family protein [Armatimonadetes bacterium]|nr:PD-(D/E)XK nuclease family protein [Armatimonadota bacterium]
MATKKPSLSPTRLSNYLACPTKYRWTYLDRRGRYYLRSRSYYSFGTSLHRVLEKFHDSGEAGVATVSEALAAFEESWIEAGYSSQQEMEEALGEGRAIVESYVTGQLLKPRLAKALFVEKRLTMDMGDFVLLGQIDRVDEHEDGSLEIIDYKSGRSSVSAEDIESDLAMSCYQLLLRDAYPGREVRATIIALRTQEEASFSLSGSQLTEFEGDVRFIGGEMIHREWEYVVPSYKSLCKTCEFLPLCRNYEEFSFPEED